MNETRSILPRSKISIQRINKFPDWTIKSNPHLAIISKDYKIISEFIGNLVVGKVPTLVLGKIDNFHGDVIQLSKINILDTCVINHATMGLFSEILDILISGRNLICRDVIAEKLSSFEKNTNGNGTNYRIIRCKCSNTLQNIIFDLTWVRDYCLSHRLPCPRAFDIINKNEIDLMDLNQNNINNIIFEFYTNSPEIFTGLKKNGWKPEVSKSIISFERELMAENLFSTGKYKNKEFIYKNVDMDIEENIFSIAFNNASEKNISTQSPTIGVIESFLSSHEDTAPISELLKAAFSGTDPKIDFEYNGKKYFINIEDHAFLELRLSMLINAFFGSATDRGNLDTPKLIIINLNDINLNVNTVKSIETILRQGRKFNCIGILISDTVNPLFENLCGNIIADHGCCDIDDILFDVPESLEKGEYFLIDNDNYRPWIIDINEYITKVTVQGKSISWSE